MVDSLCQSTSNISAKPGFDTSLAAYTFLKQMERQKEHYTLLSTFCSRGTYFWLYFHTVMKTLPNEVAELAFWCQLQTMVPSTLQFNLDLWLIDKNIIN